MREVIQEGTYDRADYEAELAAAPTNHQVGTKLVFENDRVGVWEIRLQPGERGAFHIHDRPYFWTVVDAGDRPASARTTVPMPCATTRWGTPASGTTPATTT